MVHDSTRADNWYHDTMVKFSIFGLALYMFEQPKWRDRLEKFDEEKKLTHIEQRLRSVEKSTHEVRKHIEEVIESEGYYLSKGLVTGEENLHSQMWHARCLVLLDKIPNRFRGFRAHKSMDTEEYQILYDTIKIHIDELRELLRDRYAFECEIERRELIENVVGT
jgi:hypothetical protein